MIEVEGRKYKVTENLGYSHDRGQYAKAVMTEAGERIAVRDPFRGAPWRFSKPIVILTVGHGPVGQSPDAELSGGAQ